MCCCGDDSPPLTRITASSLLEVSYDGGDTWEDGTSLDPRFTSTQAQQPLGTPGDEMRCNGAASAVAVVRDDFVYNLQQVSLGLGLLIVIAAILAIFLSAGSLAPIVTALVTAALGFGAAAIEAAFTPTVWEEFKCILYCNMEDDASFTEAGWQQVRISIQSAFSGVAEIILLGVVDNLGVIGLTNIARSSRAEEDDCSECDCDDISCSLNMEFGEIISTSGNIMTIAATPDPAPGQPDKMTIQFGYTNDPVECCYVVRADIVGGTVNTNHFNRCDGAGFFNNPEGQCVRNFYFTNPSGGAFTIELEMYSCGSP